MGELSRHIDDYVQGSNGQYGECRSSFGAVPFKRKLEGFDSKYADQGRFGFEIQGTSNVPETRNKSTLETVTVPRLGVFVDEHRTHAPRKHDRAFDQHPEHLSLPDSSTSGSSSSEYDDTDRGASCDASVAFDESSTSDEFETENEAGTISLRKRKREQVMDHIRLTASSISTSLIGSLPNPQNTTLSTSDSGLDFFPNELWTRDQSPGNSHRSEFEDLMYTGNDTFFIQIAQILADQSILEPVALFEPFLKPMANYQVKENISGNNYGDPLTHIVPRLFTQSERCRLKEYTALSWVGSNQLHGSSSIRRGPIRPSIIQNQRALSSAQKHVFKLEPPYTCIRRAGAIVEVSPSALNFWDELGLAPAHDRKDITAFCVFAAQDYIQDGVETFLSLMTSAYENCSLGSHKFGSILPNYQKGLVPVPISSHRMHDFLEELGKTCEKLGKKLAG